ncbi:enolase-like [Sycon ciliatum]|uniref:enolase-like n=1 Tax=Sycon ciliatum TaxID=27933 RepID=UPI0031F663CE
MSLRDFEKYEETSDKKRKKVREYFDSIRIEGDSQELVNKLYLEKPKDVNGYATEFFSRRAHAPTVTKCVIRSGWSVNATPGVVAELYGILNGVPRRLAVSAAVRTQDSVSLREANSKVHEAPTQGKQNGRKKATSSQASISSKTDNDASSTSLDTSRGGRHDLTPQEQSEKITSLLGGDRVWHISLPCHKLMNGPISQDIKYSVDVLRQNTPFSSDLPFASTMATSLALLSASTFTRKRPSVVCFIEQVKEIKASMYTMPFLVIPMLSCGPGISSGKLKWQEFSLVPNTSHSIGQVVENIQAVHQCIRTALAEKSGASATGQLPGLGTFLPSLDKPEQAMELLQTSATDAGLELGSDFDVCVTVAGGNMYDSVKNKYELWPGQQKSPADTVEQLATFLGNWPAVKMLIDPLHKGGYEDWQNLQQKVGQQCVLIGSDILAPDTTSDHGTQCILKQQATNADTTLAETEACKEGGKKLSTWQKVQQWKHQASNTILWPPSLSFSPTVSHLLCQLQELGEKGGVMFSFTGLETQSELLLDVAIVSQCQYLRLPSPVLSPVLYDHLLEIHQELQRFSKLNPQPAQHCFSTPKTEEPPAEGLERADMDNCQANSETDG